MFVKENSWPELVPELASVIQNSNLISGAANCEWNTINALTVLQALIRPFQVLFIYKHNSMLLFIKENGLNY